MDTWPKVKKFRGFTVFGYTFFVQFPLKLAEELNNLGKVLFKVYPQILSVLVTTL